MPLVLMCGYPGSGKSTRALELFEHLKSIGKEVIIVNEESLNIDRAEGYKDATKEKLTRGSIKAAVERSVTKEVTVIVDSLNYIKGYRYELYCLARAATTPHLVIYCETPKESIFEWNMKRESGKWDENILDVIMKQRNKFSFLLIKWNELMENRLNELMMRFEQPNPKQRWDDPCYLIHPGDVLPVEEMAAILASAKQDSATYATKYSKVSDTNYLFDIEKVSQEAIATILEASNQSQIGDAIAVPNATKKVTLIKTVTMAELRRLRRQYLTLTRQMTNTQSGYTQQSLTSALNDFIDYINAQLAS